jgi:hypothetical protein
LVSLLAAAAIWNATVFLRERETHVAYLALAALTAAKTALVLLDYRLTMNQHYMAVWVAVAFLLSGNKVRVLSWLIVSFYVGAGLLKFNSDWLSGAALYGRHPLGLPTSLIPAACAYVIVLELAVAPCLLLRNRWLFWGAYLQLIIFHVSSFWVVGFFYPILMFLVLSLFPLSRLTSHDATSVERRAILWFVPPHSLSGRFLLGMFAVCQIVPRTFPGDVAITGEGRWLALNMFDAPLQCKATAVVKAADGSTRGVRVRPMMANPRLECDPIVYLELARAECRKNAETARFVDFDLLLETKRVSQDTFQPIVALPNFCGSRVRYKLFQHNTWIQVEQWSKNRALTVGERQ